MSITNLLARGFDPMPAGGQANALMQVQQLRAGQQRNALMQQQMEAVRAEQAQAQRNALMQQQWRDSLQVPQGTSVQVPGMPAMNAAQAESAAGLPGYGMSSSQDQTRMMPADPRQVQAVQMAKAGQMTPQALFDIMNPKPEAYTLAPGAQRYEGGKMVTANPVSKKVEAPKLPPLADLHNYRANLPPGDPRIRDVDAMIANLTRPPKYAGGGGPGAAPAPKPEKVLPQPVVKLVTEARDNATAMDGLAGAFKPEYAGKGLFGLGADMQMGASANLGVDKDAVNWWKDYRKNIELVERHAMFGASLTVGEQGAWRSADISPGMDAEVIKTNLATRKALAAKVLANAEQDMIDAGHSEERVRNIAGRNRKPETPEAPPAAPVRTATNPKTGEKLQLVNGQWVPVK
jgi:hypothetical protein